MTKIQNLLKICEYSNFEIVWDFGFSASDLKQ